MNNTTEPTLAESRSKTIIHSVTGMHYDRNPEFVLRVAKDLVAAVEDAILILQHNAIARAEEDRVRFNPEAVLVTSEDVKAHLVPLTDEVDG